MATHIIWADQAPAGAVEAPTTERQHLGWTREAPPCEWFNWHMRRTDTRLADLERPWIRDTLHSPVDARAETIKAGESFGVPEYQVGADRLEVWLDGIPCLCGEAAQYREAGDPGDLSTAIMWNDDIDPGHDILVRAPRQVRAEYVLVDEELLAKLPTGVAVLRPGETPPDNLPSSGLIIQLTDTE